MPGRMLPLATPACVLAPVLSHTRRRRQHLLPGSGQPAAWCAAAGCKLAVAVAITSSALLQCCSVQRPNSSSGTWPRPTAAQGPGLLPSPGYFPRTGQNLHPGHLKWNTQVFFSSLLMGLPGVFWHSGLLNTTLHHHPVAANESHYARYYSFASLHLVIINTRKENGLSKVDGLG